MSLYNKQYDDFAPAFKNTDVLILMHVVGVPSIYSNDDLDEFVARATAFELVCGNIRNTGPFTEQELRSAFGCRVRTMPKTRAQFRIELGESALKRLDIHL